MLSRLFAAGAVAMLSFGVAQAGSISNGTWTPSSACADPGEAPTISSKSPEAYNSSAKQAQTYQDKAKAYADCVQKEAKADQEAVVTGANSSIGKINTALNGLNQQSQEAVDKLKKKGGH